MGWWPAVCRALGKGCLGASCSSLLAKSAFLSSLLSHPPLQLARLQHAVFSSVLGEFYVFFLLICFIVIFMSFYVGTKASMCIQPSLLTQRAFYHRVLSLSWCWASISCFCRNKHHYDEQAYSEVSVCVDPCALLSDRLLEAELWD